MDNLDLLLKLVKAEDEEEVNKIIASHPLLSKDENWRPLAGERSNIGLAHAQQASPIPVLIEKPINSIDALWPCPRKLDSLQVESPGV